MLNDIYIGIYLQDNFVQLFKLLAIALASFPQNSLFASRRYQESVLTYRTTVLRGFHLPKLWDALGLLFIQQWGCRLFPVSRWWGICQRPINVCQPSCWFLSLQKIKGFYYMLSYTHYTRYLGSIIGENSVGRKRIGLLFLRYKEEKGTLIVTVVKCENLTTCDPYVKFQLLPDKQQRVKTRVLRHTRQPVFDEDFTFYGVQPNQLEVRFSSFYSKLYFTYVTQNDKITKRQCFSQLVQDVTILKDYRRTAVYPTINCSDDVIKMKPLQHN